MIDQSFWQPGSIVKLQEPFKPGIPDDSLRDAVAGIDTNYHQIMVAWDKWQGFTHGIIAQCYAHDQQGNVSNVSLFLYDPEKHLIYTEGPTPIPTYFDYHVSELTPVKQADVVGYETIDG